MHYTGPVVRPPHEANSILLEVTVDVHTTDADSVHSIRIRRFEWQDRSRSRRI